MQMSLDEDVSVTVCKTELDVLITLLQHSPQAPYLTGVEAYAAQEMLREFRALRRTQGWQPEARERR